MNLLNTLFFLLSLAAMLAIVRNRFHLLIILLSLETLMLSMIMQSLILAYSTNMSYIYMMIILSLSACEASIGLAMLVSIIRSQGSDSMKVLSIQKL